MTQTDDWWEGFFEGFWLDVQRLTKTKEQTESDATFVEAALGLSEPSALLDVPCGEGRLSVELARRGHSITGVDRSWPLLEDGRQKSEAEGLSVAWHHSDMQNMAFHEEFDAALCMWGSIGYFDDQGNRAFFEGVYRALRPGGRFVIDTHVTESLFVDFQPRTWKQIGEILVLEERTYDPPSGRLESSWTFVRSGMSQERRSSIRIYAYRELCALLKAAGFVRFKGYGSLEMEPFKLGSPRLYLVATKHGAKKRPTG